MDNEQLHVELDNVVQEFKVEIRDKTIQWSKARTPSAFFDFEQELQVTLNTLQANIARAVLEEIHRDKAFIAECQKNALIQCGAYNDGQHGVSVQTLSGRRTKIKTPYSRPPRKALNDHIGFRCRKEQAGIYPVLRQLGIVRGSTPRFLAEVSRQMADGPSGHEAEQRLSDREIFCNQPSMWRLVRDFASIALWQREVATKNLGYIESPENGALHGRRVVVSLDGGRIRIRTNRKLEGRNLARSFTTGKCEPKLFAIYCIDEKGNKDRSGNVIYDGTIQSTEHIFELLTLKLKQLSVGQAKVLVILGDGAPWIWKGAADLQATLGLETLRVIEVVDWAHAVGKLSEAAKLSIKGHTHQQVWFRQTRRLLKKGQIDHVIALLSELDRSQDKEHHIRRAIEYFQTHQARMQYPSFRKEGLPIGSGVVESGVRRIINMRLKGTSTFWQPENAEQILCLRCQIKSGQWESFVKSTLLQWAFDTDISLKRVHQVSKQITVNFLASHPPQCVSDTRQEVIKWARRLLEDDDALLIDTETTGLNDDDEVIQLAVLNLRGEILLSTLLRPVTEISDEAISVHGITNQKLGNAPILPDIYENLKELLHHHRLVAYNAEFDRRLLVQTCKKRGLPEIDLVSWDCLMEKYACFWGKRSKNGSYRRQSLKDACDQQGLTVKEAHEAVKDCLLALDLIKAMAIADDE